MGDLDEGKLPSLERHISSSEAKASQVNETVIESLSNFEKISLVGCEEAALHDGTQKRNEMQVWDRRMSDKTKQELSEQIR